VYKIHVDHLGPGAAAQPAQVITGWTVAPDASESVTIRVNGRPVGCQSIPRPDVEAVLPGRNGKGFRFFVEPELDTSDYNIVLAIGDASYAIAFSLGVDGLEVTAETISPDRNPMMAQLHVPVFVNSRPSHQNAVDLFKERGWLCTLPVEGIRSGDLRLFDEDRRPQMVVDVCGSIEGFKILELGPCESAHTYQLERLGAGPMLCIEASPEFYLKSLIAKEILGLKAHYLLGDFNRYLEESDERYDLIFASGVLYHMLDPLHTLQLLSLATSRLFIWSHYIHDSWAPQAPPVERHGFSCHHFEIHYPGYDNAGRRCAGVMPSCNRLYLKDIVGALQHFGFDKVTITEDNVGHVNGPAVALVAEKSRQA
jgi:hypothetical protein